MTRFHPLRRSALLAAPLLLIALSLAGCSHKLSSSADATYTQLEGVPDTKTQLFVWPDTPDSLTLVKDLPPVGPSAAGQLDSDVVLGITPHWRSTPGSLHLMLMDGTDASGFQLFRKASNGGLQELYDFPLRPLRKWLSTEWELYETADATPSGFSPPTYVARGLLNGIVTARSPISNVSFAGGPLPTNTIAYNDTLQPTDSTFRMTWMPTAAATWQGSVAGFWIHIYDLRAAAGLAEITDSGTPSPVWAGNVTDLFVGYIPAPTMSYKLGTPAPPGGLVMTYKPPVRNHSYLVRVTAVDTNGRVLAFMSGANLVPGSTSVFEYTFHIDQHDGFYYKVPEAAVEVHPRTPRAGER